MRGHTWLDILHGLLGARNFITGEGFRTILTNVHIRLLRRGVGLDDARGNPETRHLLSDGLAKASRVPPN